MKKAYKIESESEAKILDDVQNDRYTPLVGDEKEKIESLLKSSAKNTAQKLQKRKSVTLRLFERDIERIKASAMHEGMPYQTYIAHLIHKISIGEIKPKI